MPLSWVMLIAIDACLIAFSSAQEKTDQPPAAIPQVAMFDIEAPSDADDGIRFQAIDVFMDSGVSNLAAWQIEVESEDKDVEIVGIEGGEHSAFAEPAYYDPRAMNGNRVILAAYSLAKELPSQETRIARIHIRCEGRNVIPFRTKLAVATNAMGEDIAAKLTLAAATSE